MKHKDGTKIYNTIAEASEDPANKGYSVKTIRLPETLMDQIRQLTWRKADRQASKGAFNTG